MPMDRRSVLKGASGIAAASALSGCLGFLGGGGGGSDEPKGDSMIWHALAPGEQKTFESNLETFNNENSEGYKVIAEETSDLQSRVETQLASNDGPEMYRWAHDWVGSHYNRDFLYDASDDISINLEDHFTQAAVQACTIDGATVGLPIAGQCPTLLYNKDMVDSAPSTFSEFESIMEEHYDPTSGKYGIGHPVDAYFVSAWLHAYGGFYFRTNDSGEAELGHKLEETHKGMKLFRDRVWPYMAEDTAYDPQTQSFSNGNAPFVIDGPWAISDYEDKGINVGVAPFPDLDGDATPRPYTGVDLWYFSTLMGEDETRRDASISFAEWHTTNKDLHLTLAEKHSFIPVLNSISTDELGEKVSGFQASFSSGIAMPNSQKMNGVWGPTEDAINAVLLEDADIATAFSDAEKNIRSNWE